MITPLLRAKRTLVTATFLVMLSTLMQAQNHYVSLTATGAGNGSSWTNAFTNLQTAIDAAGVGDSIFVAAATYVPTFRFSGDSLRHSTFYINKDILIFGGFSGAPGTENNFLSRDPILNKTILSGDLGIPGDRVDNAFHVVFMDHVSDSCKLDGFTISDGSGVDGSGFETVGNGIFNDAQNGRSNPTIANCIIRDHQSNESGCGMMIYASGGKSNSLFTNCQFINNATSGGGGLAIYTDNEGEGSPTFINCRFVGNTARTAQGSAVSTVAHSSQSSPQFINCIFTGNHAPTSQAVSAFLTGTGESILQFINCTFSGNSGGVIRLANIGTGLNSKIIARNSVFWGNGGSGISANNAEIDVTYSANDLFLFGEGNNNENPNFILQPSIPVDSAHTSGDVHIAGDSPAIDAGSNAAVPTGIVTDLDGLPRFINPFNGMAGTVDMGAYEVQESTSSTADLIPDSAWNVFPNPSHGEVDISFSDRNELRVLQLLDATGIIVLDRRTSSDNKSVLRVDQLPAGMYYVHVILQNGKHGTKALLVE